MPLVLSRHTDPSLPLPAAIAEFLADCRLRQLSARTIEWYRYTLQPFARFATAHSNGNDDVAAVTSQTVRAFLTEQSECVEANRLNDYREAIDRFYQWLGAQGYVSANPAAGIGKAREARKLIAAFNHEEVEALLRQPNTGSFIGLRDWVFMVLLLDTGIRLSEALGLRVSDLDLPNRNFKVLGKGRKERLVGVSPLLEGHLRRYLARRQAALDTISQGDSPWLLPNQCGGKLVAKTMQQHLKQYARQAGVTRVRVSPHTFRHTFALWFVRAGGSPFHLQKILGHESLDMARRYCDLADIDFLSKQQELSPLASLQSVQPTRRRMR